MSEQHPKLEDSILRRRTDAERAEYAMQKMHEYLSEAQRLKAQLAEARIVLSRAQWGDRGACGECGGYAPGAASFIESPSKDGHAPDCRLKKALGDG